MLQSTLNSMVKSHALWLSSGGKKGKQAVFNSLNAGFMALKELSFDGLCLKDAIFTGISLSDLSFKWANLTGAHFGSIYARTTDFSGADMSGANLGGDFTYVNFEKATLNQAKLNGVFRCANFQKAAMCRTVLNGEFTRAVFVGADLTQADGMQANMQEAVFDRACTDGFKAKPENMPPLKLPSHGQFHGFKKVRDGVVLELVISGKKPRTATYIGNKCRCQKAKVIAAYSTSGKKLKSREGDSFVSIHDVSFRYYMGQWVEESDYNGDPMVECTRGIHFFRTIEEAIAYG